MEEVSGSESVDKTKVLNVKPLRSLAPVFPASPGLPPMPSSESAAFVCVPPTGPFPPGFTSFYPFNVSTDLQTPPGFSSQAGPSFGFNNPLQSHVPVSSFKTPVTQYSAKLNGRTGVSKRGRKRNSGGRSQATGVVHEEAGFSDFQSSGDQYLSGFSMHVTDAVDAGKVSTKRTKPHKRLTRRERREASSDGCTDSTINDFLSAFNLSVFDTDKRGDGDRETVKYVLMVYSLLKRRITQIEDSKESTPGVGKRPDLKAATTMLQRGIRTNLTKRTGAVPGVEVGDIFFLRMEMCLVGMHAPSMAGIDYMSVRFGLEEDPVAVSIVSSGGYEDNVEDGDGDVLVYSGQGGNIYRKDKDIMDQKLERGNLALEKSLHRGNEVRVIRGMKDAAAQTGKVYVYDGIYRIQESWVEKGKSGCNVFKYKLFRIPGQPEAFTLWKSIQQWKDGVTSRTGAILSDLSSGTENLPVSLVNEVDDEKEPSYFTYLSSLKYPKPVISSRPSLSCNCRGGCQAGDLNCPCVQRNGGSVPYAALGVLLSYKSLIYECGPSCPCPLNCRGRISQAGLKLQLEVFKTKDRGWGLRSWDPIRAGAFICIYAGEVIDKPIEEVYHNGNDDNYIFDATRTFEPQEVMLDNSDDSSTMPFQLVISAKHGGNVARFMNHSCSPNVYWQPVLQESDNETHLNIAFFAINHIPPMQEMTFDYGIIKSGKAEHMRKKCLCGSLKCRGYYY